MGLVYEDQVDASIRNLAKSIIEGKVETDDVTTLSYYGMKLVGAIEKLRRAIQYSPIVYQEELRDKIEELEEALVIIRHKVAKESSSASVFFSSVTDDDNMRNNPLIKALDDCKIKGFALGRAIKVISGSTGTPELAINNFIKVNKLKYPSIKESSVEYIQGQEDAKSLAKSRILDLSNRIYDSQKQFLRKYPKKNMDSISYLAGFSNIANSCFSRSFIEEERQKGKLISMIDDCLSN